MVKVQFHSFACWCFLENLQVFWETFFKDRYFSLLNSLLILVKNQLSTEVSFFLCSQFYSILLFVYSYARTTNFDYFSFLMHFEIRKCVSFSFVLFQRYYCYSGFPWKSTWILAFVHFCKKKKRHWGFDRDCLINR